MVTMRADETSLTGRAYWEPLWGNLRRVPVSTDELNAISKISEKTKIALNRFETVLDYKGQKTLRMKKLKQRDGEHVLYSYYFIPVFFERGLMYSHQFCEKQKKTFNLQGEDLTTFIRNHTGIRPSSKVVRQPVELKTFSLCGVDEGCLNA